MGGRGVLGSVTVASGFSIIPVALTECLRGEPMIASDEGGLHLVPTLR